MSKPKVTKSRTVKPLIPETKKNPLKGFDRAFTMRVLKKILTTPSPTGMTGAVITEVENAFTEAGFHTRRTNKGALVAALAQEWLFTPEVLFAAHADTLGGMVQQLKPDGRIMMTKIGSYTFASVAGIHVRVFGTSGKVYDGTLLPVKSSHHAHGIDDIANFPDKSDNHEIRVDIDAPNRLALESAGIRVGDFVAFDEGYRASEGFVCSRHLDDKAGVAALAAAAKALSARSAEVLEKARPFAFFISTFEEVGHGAAPAVGSKVKEMIVADMAVVAPGQESSEKAVTICALDSSGPYDLNLRQALTRLAENRGIPHRIDIYPFYGSDGSCALRAGQDVRVALIGPGVDASHAIERTHIDGILSTAALISAYILDGRKEA